MNAQPSYMRNHGRPAMSLLWNLDNPGALEVRNHLSFREAWRVGWAVVWPAVLLNAFFWVLEVSFGLSEWAAIAVQAANVALVAFVVMPKAISRAIQSEFPRFHLAISRREAADLSRSLSYRERLRLSIRAAIFTGGLAVLPLAWVRSLLTAGQNPALVIPNGILALGSLSLPLWAAAVLMFDVSSAFSLGVVRKEPRCAGELRVQSNV